MKRIGLAVRRKIEREAGPLAGGDGMVGCRKGLVYMGWLRPGVDVLVLKLDTTNSTKGNPEKGEIR